MILYQWRGPVRNFGDELNTLLWPALLPDFFDSGPDTRFLGIGSILDGRHDAHALKLVAGSGYGGYEAPITLDETWIIHWVRGPRTARFLNLSSSLALGDPASLIPFAVARPIRDDRGIGFMPHFESAQRGAWDDVCAMTGLTLIDPRGDPGAILAAIARCRMLISEALHGVIVADALRVPWVSMEPLAPIHRAKWLDWAETLDLTMAFQRLRPSTALEQAHLTGLSRFHMGRRLLNRQEQRLRGLARQRHAGQAARALRAATFVEPCLSRDTILDRGQTRMMEAIDRLRRCMRPVTAKTCVAPPTTLRANVPTPVWHGPETASPVFLYSK